MNNLDPEEAEIVKIDKRSKEMHEAYDLFRDNLLWACPEIGEETAFRSWIIQKVAGVQIICENLAEECFKLRSIAAFQENNPSYRRKRKS